MKVLITAPPKAGKSTLICHVINSFYKTGLKDCQGVLCTEKLDPTGTCRVGFTAHLSDGRSEMFMTKCPTSDEHHVCKSDLKVGPYHVKVNVIEEIIVPKLQSITANESSEEILIYIDEIGRAQALSPQFLSTVCDILLHTGHCVLGSIVHDDEEWSKPFKCLPFVWLVEVTANNRDFLPRILESMFSHSYLYNLLSEDTQLMVKDMFFELMHLKMFHSARKLFSNTLLYLREEKILTINGSDDGDGRRYAVAGMTSKHVVMERSLGSAAWHSTRGRDVICEAERFSCDCPLSTGLPPFQGETQICSHVLAVLLLHHHHLPRATVIDV